MRPILRTTTCQTVKPSMLVTFNLQTFDLSISRTFDLEHPRSGHDTKTLCPGLKIFGE